MTTAVPLGLLVLAVAAVLAPRLRALGWAAPVLLAGIAVATGVAPPALAGVSVRPLLAPLAFVALAVPLAVMLDTYGLFDELARIVASGPRFLGALWVLAAVVTATLNLDVAVVLLTPLYVRVAERRGASRFAVALQPALLSSLASSALPVSNLSNLIATARDHLSTTDFLVHLGAPTVAASLVGWCCYRAGFARIAALDPARPPVADDRGRVRPASRTLLAGGCVIAVVVAGLVAAPSVGVAPYEVVAAADVVLVTMTRTLPLRAVPWRSVAIVLGLGVLAAAVARHLATANLVHGASPVDVVRTVAVTATGANLVNNLPALLVVLPATGHGASWSLWSVLLATNVGSLVLPTGSLALLLWMATMRRLGVPASERDYVRVGWWIGLPSLIAATGVLVVVRLALGAGH